MPVIPNYIVANDGVHQKWDTTIHEEMKFVGESGDYYILTLVELFDGKVWSGICGAPELNLKGRLIRILYGGISKYNVKT